MLQHLELDDNNIAADIQNLVHGRLPPWSAAAPPELLASAQHTTPLEHGQGRRRCRRKPGRGPRRALTASGGGGLGPG